MVTVNQIVLKQRRSRFHTTNNSNSERMNKLVAFLIITCTFCFGIYTGMSLRSDISSLATTKANINDENMTHTHYDQLATKIRTPTTATTTTTPITNVLLELTETLTPAHLKNISKKYKDAYRTAFPFPHIVIDDIFPKSILDALMEEITESMIGEDGCYHKNERCKKRDGAEYQLLKSNINKMEDMGIVTKQFIWFLNSITFIDFLKDVSGIRGLLPDPDLDGGGIHLTSNGGKLNIHADFNAKPGPRVDRRVNFFLFLNPDWKDEYGGHLEFWNRDLTECGARVSPVLGRIVIFSTTDFSYHGHPHPLTAPEGRVRRSIAMYYYTAGRPAEDCLDGICPQYVKDGETGHAKFNHGTLWQTPNCNSCLDCLHYVA